MNWKRALGFGLLLWVIMFVVVFALIAFKFYGNFWGKVATIVVAGIVAYAFAARVKPAGSGAAVGYGVVWVVVGLILDYLITTRFQPDVFKFRSLWVGYLVVLLTPIVQVSMNKDEQTSPPPAAT